MAAALLNFEVELPVSLKRRRPEFQRIRRTGTYAFQGSVRGLFKAEIAESHDLKEEKSEAFIYTDSWQSFKKLFARREVRWRKWYNVSP